MMQTFEERIWAEAEKSRGVLATCIAPMIQAAEMYGLSARDKVISAWKIKAKEYWSKVFDEVGQVATTQEIARHTKRSSVSIHNTMEKLGHYQFVQRAAIEALLPRIKYLDLAGRERAITQLQASCGHPELPRDLMMTSAQVQQLHQAGMEIGGHTVMHPILTELPDDQAAAAKLREVIPESVKNHHSLFASISHVHMALGVHSDAARPPERVGIRDLVRAFMTPCAKEEALR